MAKAHNKLPYLPDDILLEIFRLLAVDGLSHLAPILKSGRRGLKTVLDPYVLKDANIYNICWHPLLIQTSDDPNGGPQDKGIHRRIFKKCFKAGNEVAIYYEGLRIVAEERDIKRGISVLSRNVPADAEATLACGIFSMLYGSEQMAVHFLHLFDAHHFPLKSHGVRFVGKSVFRLLFTYQVALQNTYKDTFVYPSTHLIPNPDCAAICCIQSGFFSINFRDYDILCTNCGLWWLAKSICEIL